MAKKKDDAEAQSFLQLRNEAIQAVNEDYKYLTAVTVDEIEEAYSHPRWCLPTGITLLDGALGGGFYEGKIARWFGAPAGGKTSCLLWSVARAMSVGALCVYFDPELAFDAGRLQAFCEAQKAPWRPELLTVVYPDHLEDMFNQLHYMLGHFHPVPKTMTKFHRPEFKQPIVVAMDTVSHCPTQYEYDLARMAKGEISKVEGGGMSSRARSIKMAMRQLRKPLAVHGAALLVTEQEIASLAKFGPQTTTSGGGGLPYSCDQSFKVRGGSPFQDPDTGREVGQIVTFSFEKTRFGSPRAKVEVPLYYERGFDNMESLYNFSVTNGLFQKDGNRYVLKDEATGEDFKFFGKNWREALSVDPWPEKIEELVKKNIDQIWVKKGRES